MSAKKSQATIHLEFLRIAYCALVLRGFDSEREIDDPILRRVWRLGKRVNKEALTAVRPRKVAT